MTNTPINERHESMHSGIHEASEAVREEAPIDSNWRTRDKARQTVINSDSDEEETFQTYVPISSARSTTNMYGGPQRHTSQQSAGLFGNIPSSSAAGPASGSNALPIGVTNPAPTVHTVTVGTPNSQARTPDMMPLLGARTAPAKFKGKHDSVKRFIRQYKQMCAVYNVSGKERCKRIIDYCSSAITRFIESLDSFVDGNWDQLEDDILTYYDADLSES
ncbi:uncharacterized protein EV420DRAFT_1734657 [Desarmillaria tabescens]|uniref:Uncharacterized protein n=1 Tax=Armillaria tabescens TaxID=1929756 RepID=A0AA39TXJ5_ARMTA|nr:uncharacterized protein EV420DRAFT_1734657 [Desarmillaria tabescens]KAK0462390.1 hypothetical protein EV420DRAFT_1734657 [Desarmillaria tabescens]